jgi:nitrate reductase / nitrite oxidoreductase, beta subunit
LEPNVYYVPPVHVPPAFLKQMFGAHVREAIATYRRASDDPKLLGALLLFGSTPRIIHRYKVENGFAIGYDEQDDEVSRVPLKEPIYVRPVYDEKFGTYRSNIT